MKWKRGKKANMESRSKQSSNGGGGEKNKSGQADVQKKSVPTSSDAAAMENNNPQPIPMTVHIHTSSINNNNDNHNENNNGVGSADTNGAFAKLRLNQGTRKGPPPPGVLLTTRNPIGTGIDSIYRQRTTPSSVIAFSNMACGGIPLSSTSALDDDHMDLTNIAKFAAEHVISVANND